MVKQTLLNVHVMDLIENALALEKIVIDPMQPKGGRVEKSTRERDRSCHGSA